MSGSETNGVKKYLVGVAIGITVVLGGQSLTMLWWAARLTTTVEYLSQRMDDHETRIRVLERH